MACESHCLLVRLCLGTALHASNSLRAFRALFRAPSHGVLAFCRFCCLLPDLVRDSELVLVPRCRRGSFDRHRSSFPSVLQSSQPIVPISAHPDTTGTRAEHEFLKLAFLVLRSWDPARPAFPARRSFPTVVPSTQPVFVQVPRRGAQITRSHDTIKMVLTNPRSPQARQVRQSPVSPLFVEVLVTVQLNFINNCNDRNFS